jgi:hypothetical protein
MEELPEAFTELRSLKYLDLSGNPLPLKYSYPQDVAPNNFKIFEAFCRNNTALRLLNLDSCHMEMLPETLGNLKTLCKLNVSGNGLIYIPESICEIESLEKFWLSL